MSSGFGNVCRHDRIAVGIAAGAAIWALTLVGVPYVVTHHDPTSRLFLAATGLYWGAGALCHQRPERSFHLWSVQLPVCARCTGLYAAAPFGALLGLAAGRRRPRHRRIGTDRMRWMLVALAMPTALTVGAELIGLATLANPVRAVAALLLGGALSWLAVWAAGSASSSTNETQPAGLPG